MCVSLAKICPFNKEIEFRQVATPTPPPTGSLLKTICPPPLHGRGGHNYQMFDPQSFMCSRGSQFPRGSKECLQTFLRGSPGSLRTSPGIVKRFPKVSSEIPQAFLSGSNVPLKILTCSSGFRKSHIGSPLPTRLPIRFSGVLRRFLKTYQEARYMFH